ncbi:carboxylesterase family protein [Allokutzneria sp. A3M-2-11 16]|nr:carboxylesterase family protein [Allokutzneria sp. A3M-2-11 16]MCP3803754.1 carboxylesterase family protein [Allokutzneria sp. A3M-2-11 16]
MRSTKSRLMALGVAATLAVALLAGCSPQGQAQGAAPLTVRVESGELRGTATTKSRQFLGVPYAEPPVGELRWQLPRPPGTWTGVREATRLGNMCPQTRPGGAPVLTEDCLFVNVTTPREQRPGRKLPVMVWLHGGGFTIDSGNLYNAERMADQGQVIVVTANYRLGVLGYLGLPGLAGSGNFGLADQFAAVEWADRNAAAFGGDPDNVTVFGQSAGGMSTCAMITSPKARGLIDKAIVSSGSCELAWPHGGLFPGDRAHSPYLPVQQGIADGVTAADGLGCGPARRLECMRGKPVKELMPVMRSFADHVAFGTDLLPKDPKAALRDGDVAKIPVISGGTRDEARSFVGGAILYKPELITEKTYPALLSKAYGRHADAVAREYPITRYGSAGLAWATVVGDQSWACQTQQANRLLARHTTVYSYEFADEAAPNVNQINVPGLPMGPTHASELPSLFELNGVDLLPQGPQRDLAKTMIGYWTAFAHTGNPNHEGTPAWPKTTDGEQAMQLAPGAVKPVDVASGHKCSFWATVR